MGNFGNQGNVNKKVRLPLVIAVKLLILFLIVWLTPLRGPVLNTFASTTAEIRVLDAKSETPLFGAHVEIGGKSGETDENGHIKLGGVDFGKVTVKISKSAYESHTSDHNLGFMNNLGEVMVAPTGTSLSLKVVNKLDGKPVGGVGVAFEQSSAASAADGSLNLVIPPSNETEIKVKISGNGYIESTETIKVSGEVQQVGAVPVGKVYFLSKRTGKIDVMKSNLDGSKPEVVLAGTGKEEDGGTVLFTTRDWRYIALKSHREGKRASLYLIDTANGDRLANIDEGNAEFTPVGWYNHHFVFHINRNGVKPGLDQALKSYNADNGQLLALANGQRDKAGRYTNLDNFSILENEVVYAVTWSSNSASLSKKFDSIKSVRPDGSGKTTVKSFSRADGYYNYIRVVPYKAQELFIQQEQSNDFKTKVTYYEYEGGKITEDKDIEDKINKNYPTYLISPDGARSFWSENRDGKGNFFLGDKFGENEKAIGKLKDFAAYGWFTDGYLLLTKDESELYIMGVDGLNDDAKPVKITDYHKPDYGFYGYGYGYGGI